MIARRLAADHPDRVDRLVLVSCTDRFSPYLRQVMLLLVGVLRKLPAEAFARTIETLGSSPEYYDAHADEIEDRVKEKCAAGIPPRAIGQQLRCLVGECGDSDEPDPVAVPTLVIAGEYDALIPSCYSRAMAERIPGSRFELIQGAGHNPLQECPDRVCPLIVDFLTHSNKHSTAVAGATAKRREEGAGRRPSEES
jgi:pimeloyl-ACP methyl ester carboxylesterase